MNPLSQLHKYVYMYVYTHTHIHRESERCIYTYITICEFIHMILFNEKK